MKSKVALITGITGQDGSYLAEFLINKGYIVHGIVRSSSSFNRERIDHLTSNKEIFHNTLFLHYGDLIDSSNLNRILEKAEPDEIYNLGAQSHVQVSFEIPEYSAEVNALGTIRLLDGIRNSSLRTKFYQASTSELFGNSSTSAQNEDTNFNPRSPYAVSKLYAYWIVKNNREAYNIFASNGILFNHESERRGETFVTRKVSINVSKIILGIINKFSLGNLDAKRDWGYAPDFVEGIWKILQSDTPDDFVLATNETHTVREFIEEAFIVMGEEIIWEGKGLDEKGILKKTGKEVIDIDKRYFRPTEVDFLLGDYSKAKQKLGWEPKTTFNELVRKMVTYDYNKLKISTNRNVHIFNKL